MAFALAIIRIAIFQESRSGCAWNSWLFPTLSHWWMCVFLHISTPLFHFVGWSCIFFTLRSVNMNFASLTIHLKWISRRLKMICLFLATFKIFLVFHWINNEKWNDDAVSTAQLLKIVCSFVAKAFSIINLAVGISREERTTVITLLYGQIWNASLNWIKIQGIPS